MPFVPLPGMPVCTGSTTQLPAAAPANATAAASIATVTVSSEPSSGQNTEQKASNEELPLWVETKTAEGKVS